MYTWIVYSDLLANGNFFSQTLLTFPALQARLELACVTPICWFSQVALENMTTYIKMIFFCYFSIDFSA